MVELHHAILDITGQDPEIVHMPDFVASLIARLGWLPGAPLTRDQWLMLQRDNVPARARRASRHSGSSRLRSPRSATNGSAASIAAASSPAAESI